MRSKDIEQGKTYRNKGKGKTSRTVIEIGIEHRPDRWFSDSVPPDEPGVLYTNNKGESYRLYLSSFAAWAGRKEEQDGT